MIKNINKGIFFILFLFTSPLLVNLTNVNDSNTSLSNDVNYKDNKLSSTVSTHEHDNSWNILTKDLVNTYEGTIEGTSEEDKTTYYYLNSNVSLDIDINISNNVTLCLNGQILKGSGNDSVITVPSGASLTLLDCKYGDTLYGHDYYISNNLFKFDDNTTIDGTLYGGVITGGYSSFSGGGGITSYGTLIIEEGNIAGNYGIIAGGISVDQLFDEPAILTINGGLITGNYSNNIGGVYYSTIGSINIKNCTISENKGDYVGGISLSGNGSITMNNTTITENDGEYAGGLYSEGYASITMNNTTITENNGEYAGGLYSEGYASITMNNGTISKNNGSDGGGIYGDGSSSIIMDNVSILDNEANNDGGGVFLQGNAKFTMYDGIISNNKANNGSALLLWGNPSFTMKGGTITNNSSNIEGSDICLWGEDLSFTMTGGYIGDDIFYEGPVEEESPISITGGYFSYDPSEYLDSDYISLDIESKGGKNFDDDYVDGFPYAVYKMGEDISNDMPSLTVIEDFTYCPGISYDESNLKINVDYNVIMFIGNNPDYDIDALGFPTEPGEYEVIANIYDALIEVDGEKTYYAEITAEFIITINESHTPNNLAIKENEVEVKCEEQGSYDIVTYCSVCETELNRDEVTVDATGHNIKYDETNEYWYCIECGETFNEITDEDTSDVPDDTGSTDTPNVGDPTDTPDDTGNPSIDEPEDPDDTDNPSVDEPEDLESDGLSGGAIAGIVIGSLLGAVALSYGVCALLYMKGIAKGKFFASIYPYIKK